jgi:hypothetical protein
MKIEAGLFDHMVLQRHRSNVSEAWIAGTCESAGQVVVRVAGRKPQVIGVARRGVFRACLKGLPVGGPYNVELRIVLQDGTTAERLNVRDVLVGDVWILAGQSNICGAGLLKDAPKATPLVRAFYMDDAWRPARDNLHNVWDTVDPIHIDLCGGVRPVEWGGIGTGPAVTFGQRMFKATGVPQGLIACAHGGVTLAQWDPGLRNLGSRSMYGAMLRRFRKNGSSVAGVLWYQGESDADAVLAKLYTGRMKKLLVAMRRDLGNPRLPFVLVQLARVVGFGDGRVWNSIQDQQRRLPDAIPNCAVVPAVDLTLDDPIHLSGKAQVRLGKRLAYAAAVLIKGRSAGKLPIAFKAIHFEKDADRHTLNVVAEFANVVGHLKAEGRPSGLSIRDLSGEERAFDLRVSGSRLTARTTMNPDAITGNLALYYGFGSDPYCNIADEADRSVPVFGPIPFGEQKAITGYIRKVRVSAFQPSAGKLNELACPASLDSLGFRTMDFPGGFLDLHGEISRFGREDKLLYYACGFECGEPMRLAISLGYDGPAKMWLDGVLACHDPNGTNPAPVEGRRVEVDAAAGVHEILVAFGTNEGKAWGIFLSMERLDLPPRVIRRGPEAYALPRILG